MTVRKLARPNATWALAYPSAFADATDPQAAELNDARFVHLISCALNEDGTTFQLDDSETDDSVSFCSIGNESTPTTYNVSANLQWYLDKNTGGAGSTVDLTSLYNKTTSLLGMQGAAYWLILRVGPNASQDAAFAAGQYISYAKFETDYMQYVMEQNVPNQAANQLLFQGDVNWNHPISG